MKVALVHDWLTGMRGGERCLQAFLKLYPEADIFSLLHIPGRTSTQIDERVKGTSFLQKFPGIARYYRLCLPLFPFAVRSFDFSGYDLLISLSHSAVKNVRVPKGCVHICYCFTPMRYIRDQAWQYFGLLTPLLSPLLWWLRRWDRQGAKGPDVFIAISRFIAARIRYYYGRHSEVIYPPVETSWISRADAGVPGRAFLYAGALVPYKRPDLIVKAFNENGEPLWVVGSGPLERKLKRMAGPNIFFFGQVSDQDLARFYRDCRALIFPVREDFGMVPIECLAAGRPVIGFYSGALKETLPGIKPWTGRRAAGPKDCGVFFRARKSSRDPELKDELLKSIQCFIENESSFRVEACKERSEQYSSIRFEEDFEAMLIRHGLERFLPVAKAYGQSSGNCGHA